LPAIRKQLWANAVQQYLPLFWELLRPLTGLVIIVLGGWLVTRMAVGGAETRVPDLTGLTAEEAAERLAVAEMELEVDESRLQRDEVPADAVARQDPAAGTPVKRMRTVRVMLSTGPLAATVPDLVGDSRQRALIALEQQAIPVEYVAAAPSNEVPRDVIIAQSPPADPSGAVPRDRPLRLLASLGPPQTFYVMPDVVSLAVREVRGQLERRGFRVSEGPNRRVYANVPPGTIVSQRPLPGFRIAAGGQIVLQVSR